MRITHSQAAYILNWKKPHRFAKYCGVWSVEPVEDGHYGYYISCKIKWWIYLLLIVPVSIIEIVWSMWDGGLKYYRPSGREVCKDTIVVCSVGYDRIIEILSLTIRDQ